MLTESQKQIYIDGDKTKDFEKISIRGKPVYKTGRLKIMRITRLIPTERRKPVVGFVMWDDPTHESVFQIYWDNNIVAGSCIIPKDVHNIVLGIGIGLGIVEH